VTGHHLYLLAPGASLADIRRFYCDTLGLAEVPKPVSLAQTPVQWFAAGPVLLHIGHPAEGIVGDGHIALTTPDVGMARAKCLEMGYRVDDDVIPMGYDRFYVHDPWGNQFEILPAVLPASD